MQVSGELRADEVGRTCPFAPGDELHAVVVAAVLGRQRGGFQREHGADAIASSGFVDLQLLLWAAGVLPAEVAPRCGIVDVCGAVGHFSWVKAGAAGKVVGHFAHVFLEELTLAVHPTLATVCI